MEEEKGERMQKWKKKERRRGDGRRRRREVMQKWKKKERERMGKWKGEEGEVGDVG